MLTLGFSNFEEFKKLFVREDGKRKNRVILDMWKDKEFLRYISDKKYRHAFFKCKDMGTLFSLCDELVRYTGIGHHCITIMGQLYMNEKYVTDAGGICVDGDFRSYRYQNMERGGQVFKMRIGKMYKHLIESSEFGRHLPMSVILFMCEEMALKWSAYCACKCPEYELHVDDDFARIYDGEECVGDFGSCMTNGDNYHFYEDSVDASAAYLTNADDKVIARCVIYNKAKGEDGGTYRLAERQYSTDCDDVLKHMLVHALIKGGHIDAYKKVGAGCHSPELWLDVNGNPLSCTKFSIDCGIDRCDGYISYQDSFKWWDGDTAYNYPASGASECLSTTEAHFEGYYDSWHEEYTHSDLVTVYYHGEEYTCAEDCLDDFVMVNHEWHHEDDVRYCAECDTPYLVGDGYYSDKTESEYCCEDCKENAEDDWDEEHREEE